MTGEENNQQTDFGFDLSSLNDMSELFGDERVSTPHETDDPVDVDDTRQDIAESAEVDENQPSEINDAGEQVSDTDPNNSEEPSSQNTDDTSSLLTPYAKMLVEEGLLELDLEKFDGSVEALIEAERTRVTSEIQKGVDEYKSTLDPRIKALQDNIEAGVSLEDLLAIDKTKTSLESLTEDTLVSDASIQKDIAKQYYRETTRFSDARIEKEIERLDQLGELEEETKSFLGELKEITAQKEVQLRQQAEAEQQAAIKQQEEALANFKTTLTETKEIIPGLKLTDPIKDKIYNTLTTVVEVDQHGQPMNKIAKARLEDPIGFEMKLAYLFEVTKGFSDWQSIAASGKKNAIKEFNAAVDKMNLDNYTVKKRPTFSTENARTTLDAMRGFE